jgi:serine/threonine protein kinase
MMPVRKYAIHSFCSLLISPTHLSIPSAQLFSEVKIIDFGLSRRDDAPFGIMSSRVGTPYYVAPEVLYDCYTYKCDIWSIGGMWYSSRSLLIRTLDRQRRIHRQSFLISSFLLWLIQKSHHIYLVVWLLSLCW